MSGKAQSKAPLELVHSIPLPALHDGDFDHFAIDVDGQRLFSAAEENSKVLVFDLRTNKLIHTMTDLKAPHSMLYRADLKKLFVVDSDLAEVKVYDTDSYKPVGDIKVREGADSSLYDPSSKYLYVVDGGKDGNMPVSYIGIVDTDAEKQIGEIKIDSDSVEAMAIEKSGSKMYIDNRGKASVDVIDRNTRAVVASWPVGQVAKGNSTIALDEANHRLIVGARTPGKLLVLDTDSGKIVSSQPAVAMVDDMAFSPEEKRVYFAGSGFLDVFEQVDPDHYKLVAHVPTAFRAKTGILVPQLHRYFLGVPHSKTQTAEVRIYKIV